MLKVKEVKLIDCWLVSNNQYVRDGDLGKVSFELQPLGSGIEFKKSHINIVSSCELLTIWNSSN